MKKYKNQIIAVLILAIIIIALNTISILIINNCLKF